MGELLTVHDVRRQLKCSRATVDRLVKKGEIPHRRIPGLGLRFRQEAIDLWIKEGEKKPLPPTCCYALPSLTVPAVRARNGAGGQSEMAKANSKARFNLGYGAIYQRKTKGGAVRWYMDYRDEEGKRIQKLALHAQSKEEAALALRNEVERAFARAQGIEEQKRLYFKDFAPLYLESYAKPNKRSWVCDDYCLKAHLVPYFGKWDLREITPLHIESYRAERLSTGIKKSTTNREMALLKKMFNLGIDWGYCTVNPVLKVKLFSERDNLKERVLTEPEEVVLLANCVDHLKPIIILALNTGMRRNEILSLRWDQVDFESRTMRVIRTKSGKDRLVPLNSSALAVLEERRQKAKGEIVFPSPKGGATIKAVRNGFEGACRRAGILGLRFHDLRHTFATRLIQRGADIITVQNLLGHHSVTITQRYTHSGLDRKQDAVRLLSAKAWKSAQKPDDLLRRRDTDPGNREAVPVTHNYLSN